MYRRYVKRLLDIIFSITVLLILLPLFVLIAACIKLDSKGPVFFLQSRLGKNGKHFKIIKFRSMVVGAENLGTGLAASPRDSRITRVGAVLRMTSLDELPQIINIIKGDMSFIGPRPPAEYYPYDGYHNYPEWALKRFDVCPGMSGLAQVTYRNSVPWDDRIRLDNEYVDKMSFRTDVVLFVKTLLVVIRSKNIYRNNHSMVILKDK